MSTNLQDANVGNRGDIIKHAALLALAAALHERNADRPITYLETHAYQAWARLANRRWDRDTKAWLARYPAFVDYVSRQRPWVRRQRYLCSTGLVSARLPSLRAFLFERDDCTRRRLRRQLTWLNHAPEILGCTVGDWNPCLTATRHGPLLALVDPFELSPRDWEAAKAALARLWDRDWDGLLEVFTYQRDQRPPCWPDPPSGWRGPIGQQTDGPYRLAAYATPGLVEAAMTALGRLGWQT